MRFVEVGQPAGTVGIFSGELSRFPEFAIAVEQVRVPVGTTLTWARGVDFVKAQNDLIRHLAGDWLWLLADDHDFQPDVLLRLLAHGVEAVVPLVPGRRPPFRPVLAHGPLGQHTWYTWDEVPSAGLLKLPLGDVVGAAGFLLRRSVLETIQPPWFAAGQWDPEIVGEDLYLCGKLIEAGIPIHVDCDVVFDHITPCSVRPVVKPGGVRSVSLVIDATAHRMEYML